MAQPNNNNNNNNNNNIYFLNFKLFKYDNFYIEIEFTKKILLTTMLTIKILFTINSLKKKEKTIHSKTLFTIPVDLKST